MGKKAKTARAVRDNTGVKRSWKAYMRHLRAHKRNGSECQFKPFKEVREDG